MKSRSLLALLALLVSVAASASAPQAAAPVPVGNDARPAQAARSVSTMNPERDIVLAVANPLDPPPTRAGSSLIGYAPAGNYSVGQRAASLLATLKKQYGWREVTGWPIKALDVYCIVLEPPTGMDRDTLLKTLADDKRVQLVQPLQDYAVYSDPDDNGAHHYNDPYADLQRGFVETDAALAHAQSQGKGVQIAVVDTGVDMQHPDLQGRVGQTRNEVDDNSSTFSRDSHGTEVAGIIAAVGDNHQGIVGIAPKVDLSVYKACWYPTDHGEGARCNSFTLAKALAGVLDTDARIVNLSLGGPADPLLNRLLQQLLDRGRIVVAALPPDGSTGGFPDNTPGVIVVRTSSPTPAPAGVLSAPGNDILTTQPGGGYDFTSGSSMATAHVSGIVALMLAMSPKLDARQVHDILLRSSRLGTGGLEVNAAGALSDLRKQKPSS